MAEKHRVRASLHGWPRPTVPTLLAFFCSLTLRAENLASPALGDPVKTFNDPDFAVAQFAIQSRSENLLRSGAVLHQTAMSTWINGDYGEIKGRNYLEVGIRKGFLLRKDTRYPLLVTVPMSIAAGDEQYFFGPNFAYALTGVNVRMPLSFIPTRYGRWTFGGNADVCYFGTSTAEFIKSIGCQTPKIAAVFSVDF